MIYYLAIFFAALTIGFFIGVISMSGDDNFPDDGGFN